MEDKLHFEIEGLALNETAQYYLKDTAKWAKFLAIVGFVMCGLMVLIAIGLGFFMGAVGNEMSQTNPAFQAFGGSGLAFSFMYIVIGALYFFPCLYLFQFAKTAKKGIEEQDSDLIAEALDKHHNVYKFMGIMTAIMLGLYAFIIIIAIIVGAGAAAFA